MSRRCAWIAGVMLVGLLIGCGRSASLRVQTTETPLPPAYATAAVVLTPVAEGVEVRIEPATAGQSGIAGEVTATPETLMQQVAEGVPAVNIAAAEQTVRAYFAAFGERRATEAWALLAPAMQATTTFDMFESTTQAVQSLTLTRIDSVIAADKRLIYGVTVEAVPTPDVPTRWRRGSNQLYVVVITTPEGWRIAAITEEPPSL
ncbi:MAG: hypothetical protein ACUVSY_03210 [Roseiflexus sp.]